MLRRPFHYDNSSMYAAVGDINYIVESVVTWKSIHLDSERVGLKISDLTHRLIKNIIIIIIVRHPSQEHITNNIL